LSYKVIPDGIELKWSVPVRNRDGSPIFNIKGFRLLKAEIPLKEYREGIPPPFGRPIYIPFDARPEESKKMVYEDRTVQSGMRYIYRVCTVKGWLNVSDYSNQVSLAWHVPPSAPAEFSVKLIKGGAYLSWQAPSKWTDGRALDRELLFRVYRARVTTNKWEPLSDLIDSTSYCDLSAKKKFSYRYRVTAVLFYHGTEIEGPSTPEITAQSAVPIPPPAPVGLVAIQSENGVELFWQPETGSEISGYIVYRKGPNGLIDRLNNKPLSLCRFLDRTILPSGLYSYWVVALDKAEPANQSPPSNIVELQIVK
jgi:hypothetical protein